MTRYLSTLACSGLLGIGALYGGAFAAPLPSSIPDIIPTVNAVGEAFRALPTQPADSGIHNLSCSTAMRCDQSGLQTGVLLHTQNDDHGGVQLVRGGGGHGGAGGGGHGGGMGGGGMGSGGAASHDRGVDSGGGDTSFGFGQYRYPYRNPYYGPWYPGYHAGY
ncbi:hypothetical protein M2281_002864 [Mesorhizobium soli]|nr:hypothetical protein [Mesorhizobium soli]